MYVATTVQKVIYAKTGSDASNKSQTFFAYLLLELGFILENTRDFSKLYSDSNEFFVQYLFVNTEISFNITYWLFR